MQFRFSLYEKEVHTIHIAIRDTDRKLRRRPVSRYYRKSLEHRLDTRFTCYARINEVALRETAQRKHSEKGAR